LTIQRKVIRVIDGDTFEISRKFQGTNRIRIADLNAPELDMPGGLRAKNELKRLIEGKTVTLNPVARSYGRVVAHVRKKS
jgi:micrococcal nuclease